MNRTPLNTPRASRRNETPRNSARTRDTALSREVSLQAEAIDAAPRTAPGKLPASVAKLRDTVLAAIEDLKGRDAVEIDIRDKTSFADLLVIVSGTSSRHVRSIADEVAQQAKAAGSPAIGVEGEREGEWVLVDLADIVVHVMLPRVREFYGLERLWQVGDVDDAAAAAVALAPN